MTPSPTELVAIALARRLREGAEDEIDALELSWIEVHGTPCDLGDPEQCQQFDDAFALAHNPNLSTIP